MSRDSAAAVEAKSKLVGSRAKINRENDIREEASETSEKDATERDPREKEGLKSQVRGA